MTHEEGMLPVPPPDATPALVALVAAYVERSDKQIAAKEVFVQALRNVATAADLDGQRVAIAAICWAYSEFDVAAHEARAAEGRLFVALEAAGCMTLVRP